MIELLAITSCHSLKRRVRARSWASESVVVLRSGPSGRRPAHNRNFGFYFSSTEKMEWVPIAPTKGIANVMQWLFKITADFVKGHNAFTCHIETCNCRV